MLKDRQQKSALVTKITNPELVVSNAKTVTEQILSLFPKSLPVAVQELANDPIKKEEEKYLYVPCAREFQTRYLENSIFYPEGSKFVVGQRIEGQAIYTEWSNALEGEEIVEGTRERIPHSTFIICRLFPRIIVGHVDRDGKSLLTPTFKKDYFANLVEYYGKNFEWAIPVN